MQLAQLQQAFVKALNGDSSRLSSVLSTCRSDHRQLEVYRHNRRQARLAALTQTYPICLKILGDHCFNQLAQRFLAQHTGTEWDLNRYGEGFGDFLHHCRQLSDYAYLGDLARLEYLLNLAYYARDDVQLGIDRLQRLTAKQQESIVFKLSASLYLLSSQWPLFELHQAYENDSLGNSIAAQGREDLVVFRRQYKPRVTKVNRHCFQLLEAIAAGNTLLQICHRPAGEQLLGELHACCRAGWICGFGYV